MDLSTQIKEYLPHGLVNLKKRKQTDYIIVTCTDTKPDKLLNIKDIDKLHRGLGWTKAGYHFLINKFGEIQKGRELEEHGCHTWGYDDVSVGICLCGGRNTEGVGTFQSYFDEQLEALVRLLTYVKGFYPDAEVTSQNHLSLDEKPYLDVVEYKKLRFLMLDPNRYEDVTKEV